MPERVAAEPVAVSAASKKTTADVALFRLCDVSAMPPAGDWTLWLTSLPLTHAPALYALLALVAFWSGVPVLPNQAALNVSASKSIAVVLPSTSASIGRKILEFDQAITQRSRLLR